MALNPIVFTEKVVRSFLRYQLTAYPFAYERLHAQMRRLLSLDETRRSPLLKGPYISLSRPFRQGPTVEDLVNEGVFHPHMRRRIPAEITRIYGHQEEAIRAIRAGRTTLVSTGTGSGKTECFLYPVMSKCLALRDEGAPAGISAVIVYPMNALAEDQLGRLRSLLAGTGIPFGMYVGKTPEREAEVAGIRLPAGASLADYEAKLAEVRRENRFFGVPQESVVTVSEAYESEVWVDKRITPPPVKDVGRLLNECVQAVEDENGDGAAIRAVYRDLTAANLAAGKWPEALYAALSQNELVFQLSEELASPRPLHELPVELEKKIGRPVTEAVILAWLTLGAAARREGRPLVRPVVHGFIRGISGAVVTFPESEPGPKLWLAAEDEIEAGGGEDRKAHFPVTTCTTCGQHHFIAFLKDFDFSGRRPGGGEADGGASFWLPLEEAQGGRRVVLLDRIVGGSDDEDLEDHERTAVLYFCRRCGAAHPVVNRCRHCGAAGETVVLYAMRQKKDNPGKLASCLSCGSNGRRIGSTYREPARPVRATNVADVHVLAQDMVHHSERPRLLVFCDNRQDATFQAGWMKDHARRFRLRALMADGLKGGAVSIGDLAMHLDEILEKDEALSRALVPEVWQVVRREGGGGRHEQERRKFLRIQVLREVTLSSRQSIGLEPWGRMKVDYEGLDPALPWIQENAHALGMPSEDMRDGVAGLLDYLRRKRVLYDPEWEIFTKYWQEGDLVIQQGYLPQVGGPVGTKFHRDIAEKPELVTQWFSERGDTTIRQMARKWGVPAEGVEDFLQGLFGFLAGRDLGLLKPVRLKGARNNPLPNVSGVYQVDADRLRLQQNHGVWRCRSCRRRTTRRSPNLACPAWRCDGVLEFVREDADNYDLQLLDQGYSMLRPEKHTAMVPHDERERLENLFKGDSEAVNAFVCTPHP